MREKENAVEKHLIIICWWTCEGTTRMFALMLSDIITSGGFVEIDKQELPEEVLSAYNSQMLAENRQNFEIVKVETQVVSGQIYKITVQNGQEQGELDFYQNWDESVRFIYEEWRKI